MLHQPVPRAPFVSDSKTRPKPIHDDTQSVRATSVDPWQEFLGVRAQVIEWLIREYKWTDVQIAKQLSLGASEVLLVRLAGANCKRFESADTDLTMAAPLEN